jgi:hypothetical protein
MHDAGGIGRIRRLCAALAAGVGIVVLLSAGAVSAGAVSAGTVSAGTGATSDSPSAPATWAPDSGSGGVRVQVVAVSTTTAVTPTTPTTVPETTTTTPPTTTTITTTVPTTTTTTVPSTTTTTLAPLTATKTSSSTPWALIVVIVVLVLAIGLLIVLLAARRRRGVEATWRKAVIPALSDAQLARASLLSDNAVSGDSEVRSAVAVQVERAAVALDHSVSGAPDPEAGQMATTVAGTLRGLAFAIEADRLLRHGTAAPSGMQLAEADEARRARSGELSTAIARLSSRIGPAPG